MKPLSVKRAIRKLARHALVHGLMPTVNFLSRGGYVQHRPDRYALRFDELLNLQKLWEHGPRGTNRGDYARLYFLMTNVEALEENGVPGAFAELGVYKGSSAKIIHRLAPNRELYLFDTFAGFPEDHTRHEQDEIGAGGYVCDLADVQRFMGEHPNIIYCPGLFPATALMVPDDTCFALVHLDCDLYVPTKAALEFFYPRMTPGGILIVHDYFGYCWPGVSQAVDEFLADKPEGVIGIPDKSGTAAMVKLDHTRGTFGEPVEGAANR